MSSLQLLEAAAPHTGQAEEGEEGDTWGVDGEVRRMEEVLQPNTLFQVSRVSDGDDLIPLTSTRTDITTVPLV